MHWSVHLNSDQFIILAHKKVGKKTGYCFNHCTDGTYETMSKSKQEITLSDKPHQRYKNKEDLIE